MPIIGKTIVYKNLIFKNKNKEKEKNLVIQGQFMNKDER